MKVKIHYHYELHSNLCFSLFFYSCLFGRGSLSFLEAFVVFFFSHIYSCLFKPKSACNLLFIHISVSQNNLVVLCVGLKCVNYLLFAAFAGEEPSIEHNCFTFWHILCIVVAHELSKARDEESFSMCRFIWSSRDEIAEVIMWWKSWVVAICHFTGYSSRGS